MPQMSPIFWPLLTVFLVLTVLMVKLFISKNQNPHLGKYKKIMKMMGKKWKW